MPYLALSLTKPACPCPAPILNRMEYFIRDYTLDIPCTVRELSPMWEHGQRIYGALPPTADLGRPPLPRGAAPGGGGPVDASLKAIESQVRSGAEMVLYSVNAISGSTESQGEVTVRLQNAGRVVNGVGADPDIVVASAKAYLSALNKLQSQAERVAAQG